MTLKNNRAPLLSKIKRYASFHHHMWIQTWVTVRKRLSWVVTSVTLTFDLRPWPFAWTLLWLLVITQHNKFHDDTMMGTQSKRCDRRTDGNIICRAAWSQLKNNIKINKARNRIYNKNFKLIIFTCAQIMLLAPIQISAWNSHMQFDFCLHRFLENYMESFTTPTPTPSPPTSPDIWASGISVHWRVNKHSKIFRRCF